MQDTYKDLTGYLALSCTMRQLMDLWSCLGRAYRLSTPNRTCTLLTSSIRHVKTTRYILKTTKILPDKRSGSGSERDSIVMNV